MLKRIGIFLLIGWVAISCQPAADPTSGSVVLELPTMPYAYFSGAANDYVPTLGRVMFYDGRLSANNSISCSSCHKQAYAFADNVAFSTGFGGKTTFRNSMPIQNLTQGGFSSFPVSGNEDLIIASDTLSLFWDGREKLLGAMVLRPIANHVEMGIDDLNGLAQKLSALPEYQALATQAYGDPVITQSRISDALTRFLSTITSGNSRGGVLTFIPVQGGFSASELAGRDLFFGKYNCNSCHQTQALNGYQLGGGDGPDSRAGFLNIGLDENYKDIGFADVSGLSSDIGKFKVPTLRNVALTAPYMHDGRFATLDDVLDHYSVGIQNHPNLDRRLRDAENKPVKMNITDHDREAIKAFLNTLTDFQMVTDPRFSNPFKVQ